MGITESFSIDAAEEMTLSAIKRVCNLIQETIPEKVLIYEYSSDYAVMHTVFSKKIVMQGFKFLWWTLGEIKKETIYCYFETDLFSCLGVRVSDGRFLDIIKAEMEELAKIMSLDLEIEKDFVPVRD